MTVRFDRAALVARYDNLVENFTADALERARNRWSRRACSGRRPAGLHRFGMPRSGTTLVEQILSLHPAVSAGGELNFSAVRHLCVGCPTIGAVEAGALAKAAEDFSAELPTYSFGPYAWRVTDKTPRNFELLFFLRQ